MAQIPFTRGVPSADLLPVDALREAADTALDARAGAARSPTPAGRAPGTARLDRRAPRRRRRAGGLLERLAAGAPVPRRAAGRRRGSRRVLVEAPTYDRALILLRRAGADAGGCARSTSRPGRRRARGRRCAATARRRSSTSSRRSRTRAARRCRSSAARAARGARRRARLPDRRGRPLRPPALPRRDAADAARARSSRRRAWSRCPRSRRRSRPASASATRSRRPSSPRVLTRTPPTPTSRRHAQPGDARGLLPRRALRAARRGAPRRRSASAARRWPTRARSTSRRHALRRAGRRLLPVGRARRRGPDTTELLAAATEAGVPYVGRRLLRGREGGTGDEARLLGGAVRPRSARASRGSPRSLRARQRSRNSNTGQSGGACGWLVVIARPA